MLLVLTTAIYHAERSLALVGINLIFDTDCRGEADKIVIQAHSHVHGCLCCIDLVSFSSTYSDNPKCLDLVANLNLRI